MLQGRDYVKIQEAARILGVTEQTLRNWDGRGKLCPVRHPVNGYRMYRVSEIHQLLNTYSGLQVERELTEGFAEPPTAEWASEESELPPCHWSPRVALDPKHRPQHWNQVSTTVRRDWRKFPQEAHVIAASGDRYRRFVAQEIALLQGFAPTVIDLPDLTERQRIAALGDAVPPPLAKAIVTSIDEVWTWQKRTALEICAGIGGLASGASQVGLHHLLLVDQSPECGRLLRAGRDWDPDCVVVGDARGVSYASYQDRVGLFSGGPPCQPWSQSGMRLGHNDGRDLLGSIHEAIAVVRPEVFLFENVPGLARGHNLSYLRDLVERLRRPAEGLSYGVMVGQFNAADFGVPQVRERVFILGLRDAAAAVAAKCFDRVEAKMTHGKPGGTHGRPNWVTVGEALEGLEDPGGWRRWIGG